MGSSITGVIRLALFAVWVAIIIPPQWLGLKLGLPYARRVPMTFHRGCARILGLSWQVIGEMTPARPTLFVANHTSYLDITVLGSIIPGTFVAKAEVAAWPLFGFLATLQNTIFIRRRKSEAREHGNALRDRLEAHSNLILFPEGTSTDGVRTLPFRSALFSVANTRIDDRPLTVQPVSIACTHLDGIPLGRSLRDLYVWFGGMDLVPHLWNSAKAGKLRVEVEFHSPVNIDQLGSRKALADHCSQAVARGVEAANAGRDRPTPVLPVPQTLDESGGKTAAKAVA